MNPQVQCYYRTSLPWRSMNNKLTPIFDHIRNKNIINFFQLTEEKHPNGSAFAVPEHTNMHAFRKVIEQRQKVEHGKMRYGGGLGRDRRGDEKKMSMTLSPEYRSNNDKIMLVSSKSKIKKHLVDAIDYQGIENALYSKKARVTRFDQFYNTLLTKQRWNRSQSRSVELGTIQMSLDKTIDKQIQNDAKKQFRIARKKQQSKGQKMQSKTIKSAREH